MNERGRVNLNKDGPEPVSEDTIFYYLKLNNVAYVTLNEIITSKQTCVGVLTLSLVLEMIETKCGTWLSSD